MKWIRIKKGHLAFEVGIINFLLKNIVIFFHVKSSLTTDRKEEYMQEIVSLAML